MPRQTKTSEALLSATAALSDDVDALNFAEPVTHVYNPLRYAWDAHQQFITRFARRRKRVLFLGMNPGPWGMAQVGVPFGEVAHVRDWIGIHAEIGKPEHEHPKRPIDGFACTRSEVSGRRLWSYIAERFDSPEAFFADHYVINYCPLMFMEESGRNRTPDKLPAAEQTPLTAICDAHLQTALEIMRPEWLVGVGAYARDRAQTILDGRDDVKVGMVLHPSPASPAANRGWAAAAEKQLTEQQIW